MVRAVSEKVTFRAEATLPPADTVQSFPSVIGTGTSPGDQPSSLQVTVNVTAPSMPMFSDTDMT